MNGRIHTRILQENKVNGGTLSNYQAFNYYFWKFQMESNRAEIGLVLAEHLMEQTENH